MTPEGRILIIDDEPGVCDVCSLYLRRENFHVECIHQGDIALETIDRFQPDLVILDLMLPGRDGWDICRAVRERGSLPIIMLTARDDHEDRIQGLELGADDYIVKPFNPRELVARVKAVLRRARRYGEPDAVLRRGELTIDGERRRARLAGEPLELTPKEFDLLYMLAGRPGRVFSREELLRDVWGYDYAGSTRTVDVHVQRLRHKLGDSPTAPRFIETVHGIGYRFKDAP